MNYTLTKTLMIQSDGFGLYNMVIVHPIITGVAMHMEAIVDNPNRVASIIVKSPYDYPQCSHINGIDVIMLSTSDDYWCKWVYQFAHEYLHHLISGRLDGSISGLKWFEETLCELSSMYQLAWFANQCGRIPCLNHYAHSVRDYLRDLLVKNQHLQSQFLQNGGLRQWLPLLQENCYHRDYYNAIAARMFPLFLSNRHLWKIAKDIGDSRQWTSLDALLAAMKSNADSTYLASLLKLEKLLLP